MNQTVLQRAMKIRELEESMNNIAHDDKRTLDSYSDAEIIEEAKYVLSCFYESGHNSNDELTCEYGDKDAQREAKKQVSALKKLINGATK